MTTTKPFMSTLRGLGACGEAIDWAATQPSLRSAWKNCQRGDWMIWLVWTLNYPKARRIPCAVEIASTVAHLSKDPRVAECLRVTLAWGRGKATEEQLRVARAAAVAAAEAGAAAEGARAETAAAWAAAWAAETEAARAATAGSMAESSNIVRKHFPTITLRRQ